MTMAPSWNVGSIWCLILRHLPSLGEARSTVRCETGWISCGYHRCCRFDCGEIQAVWFLEERLLKFYRKDRRLLRVIALDDVLSDRRAA